MGPATTPISVNIISIVTTGPQVVTMTASCCSWLEEVNRVIILRPEFKNIF